VICCLPGHGAGKLCKPVVAADSLIAGAVPVVLGHSPPVQVASDVNGDSPGLPAAVLMHHIHIVGVVIGTRGLHGLGDVNLLTLSVEDQPAVLLGDRLPGRYGDIHLVALVILG